MNDQLTNVLTFAVLGFMGFRLVTGLRHSRSAHGRSIVSQVWHRIGWRHVWPVPLVLIVVVAAATALMQIPGLSWGWWSMLGGTGNPVFGESDATVGTVWEWIIPLTFMCLLLPALPLFAYAEERMFRAGSQGWSRPRRVLKVLQFGMIHALIGIPLGAALALSLGGAYFMWVYLREYRRHHDPTGATLESTAAHTVYNGLIVLLVVVAVGLNAVL
ncbi:MAG TPA: hypothetical protein PK020_11915 [Ilumatobacteraceae bacterium]|nr:hypothetical protein [Ilumatobacteraceae bacterium]HRB03479.1 hypothetical protein [Ilumatobacteraceae bacterium]